MNLFINDKSYPLESGQFIQFSHRNAEYDSRVMELLKRIFDTYQKKEYGYALQVKGEITK